MKYSITKLLEETIGENLPDFGVGDKYLDTTTKAWSIKEKIYVVYVYLIKNFCFAKTFLKEWNVKPQARQLFSNLIFDKGLELKIEPKN